MRSRRWRPSWRGAGRRSPATCTAIAFDGGGGRAAARVRRRRCVAAAAGRRTSTRSSSTASLRRAIRRCGTRALFKAMARLAARGRDGRDLERGARRCATACAAAGFAVENAPGSGGKRDITAPASRPASRRGRRRARVAATRVAGPERSASRHDQGAAPTRGARRHRRRAASPAARSRAPSPSAACRSLVVERSATLAGEGSGNAAGVFHGVVHRGDGRHARFHRAAALAAADAVAAAIPGTACAAALLGCCGSRPGCDLAEMRRSSTAQGLPADYVEALDANDAVAIAGVDGCRRPPGTSRARGWVDPRGLARAWLERRRRRALDLRSAARSRHCSASAPAGTFATPAGATIADAPVVVLCNGGGALLGRDAWPIRRQRGQINAPSAATWLRHRAAAPADRRRRLRRARARRHRSGSARARRGTTTIRGCAPPISSQSRTPGRAARPEPPPPAARPARRPGRLALGERRSPAARRRGARRASLRASARRFVGAASPRPRPAALRRARAGALRVLRARLARHRVGGARRGGAGRGDHRCAAAGRGRPARCGRPGALPEPRRFRRDEAARQRAPRPERQPPVGPIAGSAGA